LDIDAVRAALHGRYLVEQELGRGATGTVYLARSVEAQAQVAIKVLRSHSSAPEVRARLVQEAQSQSRISHPNILQVFEYDQVGEIAYLVMPFVKGQSLEAVLTSGALSIRAALAVGIAVASALECAHRAGLIHRDIKPSNVLLPGRDYHAALLTDFGLQGALDTETQSTRAGQIFGTPRYMAPEQVQGLPQSPVTDVFGLGVLLYRMIYGKDLYSGELPRVLHSILHEAVVLPETPAVGQALGDLIRRCLAKHPYERPQSAAEVLAVLRQVESQQAVALTSARPGSSRWFIVAIGGLGLLAFLVGGAVLGGRGWQFILQSVFGVGLVAGGLFLGVGVKRWLRRQKPAIGDEATRVLFGMRTRADLTQSLAIEVDQLMERCKGIDERFLGASIAIMIDEFREAQGFEDRHRALVTCVDFLEKLMVRLSPWYVRYEKLIAAIVALLGIVPGAITILRAFAAR
jgi:hypothetical protein